jgi:hypothetical protein
MKVLFFAILVPGMSFMVNAQVYTGFSKNNVRFYNTASTSVLQVAKLDSSYISGSDSIHVFETLFRTSYVVDSTCYFWGAPVCEKMKDVATYTGKQVIESDNRLKVVTGLDDTLDFDLLQLPGDSALVFADVSQQIWLSQYASDTMTIFGSPDSVRFFKFLHYDLSGTVISGTIHNSTIIFSKTYGMLNGFALDSFPYIVKPITLIGIRNPNVGFSGLSLASIYDYQPGAIIEGFHPSYPYPMTDYYRYEILSRSDSPSQVSYSVNSITQTTTWSGSYFYYVYDTNIITQTYSKTAWVDEHSSWGYYDFGIGYYYMDTNALFCNYSGMAYHMDGSQCFGSCSVNSVCYGTGDCGWGGAWDIEILFKAEFGIVNSTYSYTSSPYFSTSGLNYVLNGAINCGNQTLDINEQSEVFNGVDVYPNPATNKITIESREGASKIKRMELKDINGRNIVSLNGTYWKQEMDISNVCNGTYLLNVSLNNGVCVRKKLIIQH